MIEFVILMIAAIGVDQAIQERDQRIDAIEYRNELQQKWIEDLEVHLDDLDNTTLRLAGKHSSFYAQQQLINEVLKEIHKE